MKDLSRQEEIELQMRKKKTNLHKKKNEVEMKRLFENPNLDNNIE
jgi:hypothetical protein